MKGIKFNFNAKTMPAILVLGGILFVLLDQIINTSFGFFGPILIVVGVILSLIWAGFFKKMF